MENSDFVKINGSLVRKSAIICVSNIETKFNRVIDFHSTPYDKLYLSLNITLIGGITVEIKEDINIVQCDGCFYQPKSRRISLEDAIDVSYEETMEFKNKYNGLLEKINKMLKYE